MPGLQGLVSAQSEHRDTSDHRMIHVSFGTLRSGQNNQRSPCDTRVRATASTEAKATNGRQEE